MQWSDIKSWKESTLENEYNALDSKEKTAKDWGEEILAVNDPLTWEGEARKAADQRLDEIEQNVATYIVNIRSMKTATSTMKQGMGTVESLVNDATMRASNNNFSIADDGTVTDNDPITIEDIASRAVEATPLAIVASLLLPGGAGLVSEAATTDLIAAREQALKECADKVNEAVEKAVEIDQTYADALNKIALGEVTTESSLQELLTGPLPRPTDLSDTQAVAEWWDSLPPEEKQRLIEEEPELIGNLDGVDASDRDTANRSLLERDLKRYKEREENGTLTEEERARYEELLQLHEALETNEVDDVKQLLLYDPVKPGEDQEQLHAAWSVGDVDTAQNIGVHTGGLNTSVGKSAEAYTNNMSNIRGSSDGSTAMINFFGYDPPQTSTLPSVGQLDRAEDGGAALASFLEGVYDSRQGEGEANDVRITAIGHSYGSTTTGYALTQVRDGVVDAAVFYGSPGIPVSNVSDLNVPSDSVYAMRNSSDVIHAVPNPNDPLVAFLDRNTGLTGFDMTQTQDPMDIDGIQHLRCDTDIKNPSDAHTQYFNETSHEDIVKEAKEQQYQAAYDRISRQNPSMSPDDVEQLARNQVTEPTEEQIREVIKKNATDSQEDVAGVVDGSYGG